jgi:hypothetical protein
MHHLQSEDCTLPVAEKQAIQKCFSKTLAHLIGYPFIREYLYKPINIQFDDTRSLYYVYHNKKKLYFKKGLSKKRIRNMYNDLCIEQDVRSPHSYAAFPICYQSTDVVVDIGAAEGIWALDMVEKIREVHLFECDETWIEALQATFEPWKEKVFIVNKYTANFTDDNNTTLDDYFREKKRTPTVVKIDVEGAEAECIKGASTLLNRSIRHALICTYHKYEDFSELSAMMKKQHFEIQPSKGYMIYYLEALSCDWKDISKIFRKGLIYAKKTE